MPITVHHKPAQKASAWNLYAWQSAWDGNIRVDTPGTINGDLVDITFPDSPDARKLQFKFHSNGPDNWEPDTFIRRFVLTSVTDAWTFDSSPRILDTEPEPAGTAFNPGDVLTFHVITQSKFSGGQIYVWNPYESPVPTTTFNQLDRDDAAGISTFQVTLQPWMTSGFNLKLKNGDVWEPDAANRVWCPCDGASLWLKSGQCDVRNAPLALTSVALEVLYSSVLGTPPPMQLTDVAENVTTSISASSTQTYAGSPLFSVASFSAQIFPGAAYTLAAGSGENPPLDRPFPADPAALDAISRFAHGASAWLGAFPAVGPKPLSIQPQAVSSFKAGLTVQVSIGNGPPYEAVPAVLQPDGTWQATLHLAADTTTAVDLSPAGGPEPKPYDWIDTSRYFTAAAATPVFFTTEGIYGICARGGTQFADPADRGALMRAAFGNAVAGAGIFAAREVPCGATIVGTDVYFVVHAPHAVFGRLILVDEAGPTRHEFRMTLTNDTFYWWCMLPATQVKPGARYRFLLNDDVEVLDPGARAVQDGGRLKAVFGESPADSQTSWSIVVDTTAVYAAAHAQPWQTMGWQNFLIYEIHARRFTNVPPSAATAFDFLIDELKSTSRLDRPGYLNQLPVTVFGLMPVNEFSSAVSWGYDPSYYFAIDEFYGGASALARFVNAAHAAGRGVTLDIVYNHSLGSSLMSIAPDVYRNGDYDGDRMNCGHPMVGEYFRQVSVYLSRTFGLDGFRFDDTNTIVTKCQGGWEFLGMIRSAVRAAAAVEQRSWPYLVAENSATSPWDVSSPTFGVLDGQWGIDEVYRIKDASYDTRNNTNSADSVKGEMDNPAYWGRPSFQAVRFGESHDMVSAQGAGNLRIAARPPFGQGLRMAKAFGALTLLSNGTPMLFMGQEVAETVSFSFDDNNQFINPQLTTTPALAWFQQLMGLRNDPSKGLQGDSNYQVVCTGNRTLAYTCGGNQSLFTVVTFGTPDQLQDSGWLGLPGGAAYKEIFNSSWPAFQVESEQEQSNGGYDARISSGQILNLPFIGALVLERR